MRYSLLITSFWSPALVDSSLGSVQYSSNYGHHERIVVVSDDDSPPTASMQSRESCLLNLGCFVLNHDTPPLSQYSDVHDPLACFQKCSVDDLGTVGAVRGHLCLCYAPSALPSFIPVDENECSFPCTASFASPLCGGGDNRYNLYMCYSYEQLFSMAVDPFRNIVFKTVVVDWHSGSSTAFPQKSYYLHASDTTTGAPLIQYQIRQTARASGAAFNESVMYAGLTFDIDSSRLVGMVIPAFPVPAVISYNLVIIDIDTTNVTVPILTPSVTTVYIDPLTKLDIFGPGGSEEGASRYMLGNMISGLVSKNGIDTFIWATMAGNSANGAATKLLFIDLSPSGLGHVFFSVLLDCIVTQLAVNPYYGDVAILAPRRSSIQFLAVASVYRDSRTRILTATSFWDPTGMNPVFVAPLSETRKLNLLAGVSAALPMQNESCHGFMLYDTVNGVKYVGDDTQVLQHQPTSGDTVRTGHVPSVICFNIRNSGQFQLWGSSNGTARTINNGTVETAVSMNLFESDPGFPLTLPRPQLQSCIFSSTGLSVTVQFDSVTLMGATAVDVDHNGLPDRIDYSTEIIAPAPADACFANSSLALLSGATCYFAQSDVILLALDPLLSTLRFNDALCIKPNFVSRSQGSQWSPYSTGCCTVSIPTNALAPTPVLLAKPSLTLDVCSDLSLDASGSLHCGRACSFTWSVSAIAAIPGVDTAYSSGILAQFNATLNQFLAEQPINSTTITVPSTNLARNSVHSFILTLTSSWMKQTQYPFTVTKLSQSAPSVAIQGSLRLIETVNDAYYITAVGTLSTCSQSSSSSGSLGYTWSFTNCSVVLSQFAGILSTQATLHIPAGTHVCPTAGAWIDRATGRVACEQCVATVTTYILSDPTQRASQSVVIEIVKSAVIAQCHNPDTSVVTRGPVLYINCANSIDLDNPTAASFQGTFAFTCTNTNSHLPCFTQPALSDMQDCVTDYTLPTVSGDAGIRYPQVLFNITQGYCRVGRGILAVNTNLLSTGSYDLAVNVVQFDNLRSDTKKLTVQLTTQSVPHLTVSISGSPQSTPKGIEYPVSSAMTFSLSSNLGLQYTNLKYTWTLLIQQLNLMYDATAAQTAYASKTVYTVPQYVYNPVSTLADCLASGKASFSDGRTTLAIAPTCLQPRMQYSMHLNVTWGTVPPFLSTYTETTFATASGPPQNGQLTVTPLTPTNTTCEYPKVFSAANWVTEDTPLSYRFGYIVDGSGSGNATSAVSNYWFTDAPQSSRMFTGQIPCGLSANAYMVTVFVQVITAAGEYTFSYLQVQSVPPANPAAAASSMIQQAQTMLSSDPAQAISHYMAAISLGTPTSTLSADSLSKVAQSVATANCTSADCGNRQLLLLNTIVASSLAAKSPSSVTESLMQIVEANVQRINIGSTGTGGTEQAQTVFSALSALSSIIGSVSTTTSTVSTASFITNKLVPISLIQMRTNSGSSLSGRPGATRRLHAVPDSAYQVLSDCSGEYCHVEGIQCIRRESDNLMYRVTCCDCINLATACMHPPCWFHTPSCENTGSDISSTLSSEHSERSAWSDTRNLVNLHSENMIVSSKASVQWAEYVGSLGVSLQQSLWEKRNATVLADTSQTNQTAVNASKLIARMTAARDILARAVITSLVTNQPPLAFTTDQFTIYIGKTTNMSSVLPGLRFPAKYTVPDNSPDEPTADNPVTGFSFYYVEYNSNIYGWSLNTPISSTSTVVSLSVMKANPQHGLIPGSADDAIRVFADKTMYASGVCLMWDSLNPLSGGGWTGNQSVNDDNGCLIKKWGDIGVFTDASLIAPANAVRSVPQFTAKISPIQDMHSFVFLSVYFAVIAIIIACIPIASKLDESTPERPVNIWLEGDGISSPLSLEDNIAYSHLSESESVIAMYTLWNIVRRQSVYLWFMSYHPHFKRTERVISLGSLLSACLMFCSVMIPVSDVQNADSLSIGFIGSIGSYLVYMVIRVMFDQRPSNDKYKPAQSEQTDTLPAVRMPTLPPPLRTPRSPLIQPIPQRAPPPPLAEDASGFIERIHSAYSRRTDQERLNQSNLPHPSVPPWVQSVSQAILYATCFSWLVLSTTTVGVRTVLFTTQAHAHVWFVSVFVCILFSSVIFESIHFSGLCLLEMRRFDLRKRRHHPSGNTLAVAPARPPQPPPPPPPVQSKAASRQLSPVSAVSRASAIDSPRTPTLPTVRMQSVDLAPPPTARLNALLPGRMDPFVTFGADNPLSINPPPPAPPPR